MPMNMRILIVDDEPVVVKMLQLIIEKAGYQTTGVGSPAQALEILKKSKHQILLSDVDMPGMTGIELMQAAKKYDPMLQVLIITGQATMVRALQTLEHGAVDFLLKPIGDPEEILEAIGVCERKIIRWHKQIKTASLIPRQNK